ncbi:unnamed protein product, partial [Ectocarpus sp. 12 AP-2014]
RGGGVGVTEGKMVSTRGKKGAAAHSAPADATSDETNPPNPAKEEPVDNNIETNLPPPATAEKTPEVSRLDAGGSGDEAGTTHGLKGDVGVRAKPEAAAAAATAAGDIVSGDDAAGSVEAKASESSKEGESQEAAAGGGPVGEGDVSPVSLQTEARAGSTSQDAHGGGEGEGARPSSPIVDSAAKAAAVKPIPDRSSTARQPDVAGKPTGSQQQQQQSGAAQKRKRDTPTREPEGDGMVVEEEQGATAVVQADSSDDEDEDDGFRVVVGREVVAPAAAPVVPTKRFLRGTNTLVNTTTTSGTTASSKPVSAAAGIASLVPSKGAPVATAKPSLKPGEYPPTAELQQSTGKTAFDVDIDGMEEQPWRHPGVDIADFFNYGFTEDSWRVYCEKQLRNRYDRTLGRSRNAKSAGGRGGGNVSSGSSGPPRHGRVENSLQPQQRPPVQVHHNNSPPGPNNFRPQGLTGGNGPWGGGGGGGGGPGPERFLQGFGSGPPAGGQSNASPLWLDGQQPPHIQLQMQQQQQQQQQQQMRQQNRQNFGPGPALSTGPGGGGGGGGRGGGGGGAMRKGMNSGLGDDSTGMRSRSPDPRDGRPESNMAWRG